MSDITEVYDYSVPQKAEGKWLVRRILLISAYILFPLLVIGFFMFVSPNFVVLGYFMALGDAVLFFFTWRYVNIEYMYSFKMGVVTFSVIQNVLNHRQKKDKMQFTVRECSLIAPMEGEWLEKYNAYAPEDVTSALGSRNAEDAYFALFTGADGKKSAFLFEATNEMLKRCHYYNKDATIVKQVRY